MGDHRASIKMEVEMHGVKDKCDMWINWSPRDVDNVDHRIIEFVQNWADKAMGKYKAVMFESERESRERQQRDAELAQLARLKEKYEPPK